MLENNQLIGFGGGGSSVSHRYWRIRSTQQTTAGGGAYNFAVAEVELRATSGSSASDLCSGGTAIASSAASCCPASNAFNNNSGTPGPSSIDSAADWLAASTGIGEWVGYDAGVPISPVELWIYPANLFAAVVAIPAFAIDYSDDGASWTQHAEHTGLSWALDTPQAFTL